MAQIKVEGFDVLVAMKLKRKQLEINKLWKNSVILINLSQRQWNEKHKKDAINVAGGGGWEWKVWSKSTSKAHIGIGKLYHVLFVCI